MLQSLLLKHWKVAAIGILLALVALFFNAYQSERNGRIQAEKGRDAAINDFRTTSRKYVNAMGDIVTISEAMVLDKANFKKALEGNDLKWIKKFNDYKRTQSAQSFTTVLTTDRIIRDTLFIPCKDSIKAFRYHYKDFYNDIEATVIDTPKISIRDKYYVIVTRNRPRNWFIKFQWSRFEFHGQVTNLNRLIKTDSVQTILVK
jgi:hypothetical protein